MPLVGVPSFIEFSQKRSQQYFFVLVRKPDIAAKPKVIKLTEVTREMTDLAPGNAFVAAVDAEPWGSRETAASQELVERKRADEEAAALKARKAEKALNAAFISLPYNAEVRVGIE